MRNPLVTMPPGLAGTRSCSVINDRKVVKDGLICSTVSESSSGKWICEFELHNLFIIPGGRI